MFKPHGERIVTSFDENNINGPVLYSGDKALLNKYFNDLLLYYRVTYNHRGMLYGLRDNEVRLQFGSWDVLEFVDALRSIQPRD